MVKINGQLYDADQMTILDYLESAGYDQKRVAVEKNKEIVPKNQYDKIHLSDGDVLEVVSFVGGG